MNNWKEYKLGEVVAQSMREASVEILILLILTYFWYILCNYCENKLRMLLFLNQQNIFQMMIIQSG
jgi:hypothetical protein